jgi:hypothetical protein
MKIRKGFKFSLFICKDRLDKCKTMKDFVELFIPSKRQEGYSLVGLSPCKKLSERSGMCSDCTGEKEIKFGVISVKTRLG